MERVEQRKSKCRRLATREIKSTHTRAATKIRTYLLRASQGASLELLPQKQKAAAKKIRTYLLEVVKDLEAKNTRTVRKHGRCLKEALAVKPKMIKKRGVAGKRKKVKTPARTTPAKPCAAPVRDPRKHSNKKTTTWRWVLDQWKLGRELPEINGSVFWETSRCTPLGNSEFKQKKTRASAELPMDSRADSSPFRAHLKGRRSATSFPNLGKNATLVSPADKGKNFSHIGNFYKHASGAEMKDFWKTVAKAVEDRIKLGESVYVSTHGAGVSWLHVRIEATPKYYVSDLKNT